MSLEEICPRCRDYLLEHSNNDLNAACKECDNKICNHLCKNKFKNGYCKKKTNGIKCQCKCREQDLMSNNSSSYGVFCGGCGHSAGYHSDHEAPESSDSENESISITSSKRRNIWSTPEHSASKNELSSYHISSPMIPIPSSFPQVGRSNHHSNNSSTINTLSSSNISTTSINTSNTSGIIVSPVTLSDSIDSEEFEILDEVSFHRTPACYPFELKFPEHVILCHQMFKDSSLDSLYTNENLDTVTVLNFKNSVVAMNNLLKEYQSTENSLLSKQNVHCILHGWNGATPASFVQQIFGMPDPPKTHSDFSKNCKDLSVAMCWYLYQLRKIWLHKLELLKVSSSDNSRLTSCPLWKKLSKIPPDIDNLMYLLYVSCSKIHQTLEIKNNEEKAKNLSTPKSGTRLSKPSTIPYAGFTDEFKTTSNIPNPKCTTEYYYLGNFIPVNLLSENVYYSEGDGKKYQPQLKYRYICKCKVGKEALCLRSYNLDIIDGNTKCSFGYWYLRCVSKTHKDSKLSANCCNYFQWVEKDCMLIESESENNFYPIVCPVINSSSSSAISTSADIVLDLTNESNDNN